MIDAASILANARGLLVWLRGFAEVHAEQSMTRLIAFMLAVVGCIIGLAGAAIVIVAVVMAYRAGNPAKDAFDGVAGIVKELGLFAGGFIASGAVALLLRSQHSDGTAPSTAPSASTSSAADT